MSLDIIKETTGKASDYAPYVVELYQKKNGKIKQVEDALNRLEKDAAWLKENKPKDEILLCSEIDPYPTEMVLELITRKAIIILKKYDLKFAILTNNGFHAKRDFEILEGYEKVRFGSNLNFKLQDESDKIEPDSGNMAFWFNAILEANKREIKTWVDIVPENDTLLSQELMNKLFPLVDQWKIALPKTKAQFVPWINLTRKIIKGELEDRDIRSFDDNFSSEIALKENYEGLSNILLIAPHGFPGDDDYTDYLTYFLSKELNASFLINHNKFRKPKKKRRFGIVADLNRPEDGAKNKHIKKFIDKLITAISKVRANSNADPLVIIIHGMSDGTADENDLDFCVGAGYESSERKKAFGKNGKATASEAIVDRLLAGFRDANYRAKDGITGFTGEKTLPGYLKKNKKKETGPIDIVQIEIRYTGLREPNRTIRSAQLIGNVFKSRAEKTSFWPALAKKCEVKEIPIGEIDLSDAKFKSRIEDYGINQEKFNELLKSIKTNQILNNIIVTKAGNEEKCQLISGFRRIAALEKVCEERGQDFSKEKVWARVFTELSDEEAYNISFSENLAREDLSLWEIANSCKAISDDLNKARKSKSDIEKDLVKLTRKGARTVRRYLRLSTIQNEEIRKEIHNGNLDITTADLFAKKEFDGEDRAALHQFYKKHPMSSREFEQFTRNLFALKSWTSLKTEKILSFPGAVIFLNIKPVQLKNNVIFLKKQTGKPIDHILEHNIGFLKDSLSGIEAKFAKKPFLEKFSKRSKALESKIGKVFDTQKVGANLSIKPAGTAEDEMIKVTISAPASSIQKAIKLMDKEIGKDFAGLGGLSEEKAEKINNEAYTESEWNGAIASMGRLVDIRNFPEVAADVLLGKREARLGQGYKGEIKTLNPEIIGALVFWTKGPAELLIENPGLREVLELYNSNHAVIGLQLSVTGFGGTLLEPGIQSPEEVAIGLEKVLETGLISPEAVQLRYDPLIRVEAPDSRILKNDTAQAFEKVASLFSKLGIKLVETKFLLLGKENDDKYHHVWKRMQEAGVIHLPVDDISEVFSQLSEVAVKYNMEIFSCCVKEEQNLPGWTYDSGCISASRLTEVGKIRFGKDWDRLPTAGRSSRLGCMCSRYFDLSNIKGHKKCGSQDAACIYCTASSKAFGKTIKDKLTREIEAFKNAQRDDYYQHLMDSD
ncbi:DUF1848 family protein [Thermodesulfobacteriota bacterium]